MGTKKPLVERLRASRSTVKTEFLSRWPEIQEAVEAGFSYKAIHDELSKDGLKISYRRFVELAKEMAEDAGIARPTPSRKRSSTKPKSTKTAKKTIDDPPRYEHNPHPDENDLI